MKKYFKTFEEFRTHSDVPYDIVTLYNYFKEYDNNSEGKLIELAEEYEQYFQSFLMEFPQIEQRIMDVVSEEEIEEYGLSINLVENHYRDLEDVVPKFGHWLLTNFLDSHERPSWYYFSVPKILRNEWLIHFTDEDHNKILKTGFRFGTMDQNELGITTRFTQEYKIHGGFNFAYTLDDAKKYGFGNRSTPIYGKNAVIFNASCIRVWHSGDEEYQCIFLGKDAKNIILIEECEWEDKEGYGYDGYGIRYKKQNKFIYKNEELMSVAYWLKNNYEQYKNTIEQFNTK